MSGAGAEQVRGHRGGGGKVGDEHEEGTGDRVLWRGRCQAA